MAEGDLVAGRYRMAEPIGRGGMGEVWLAHDELLERQVAVKCARLEDARAAERLKKEARNAGGLHHPNIVGVFDFVEENGTCWIVMEYVPARSLAQILAERGPLSPGETGAIGRQIADALAASHAEGVVHGDVTPENVLVRDDGVAKLTDFGISRALWSDPTYDGSHTGGVRGKPRYLPPEVAGGDPADTLSDVFALGATLYAAVEGRSPYGEAEHPMGYIGRALKGAIEPPRQAGPLTGPLSALLRAEPRRRPDAAQVRAMLDGLAAPPIGDPVPARHDGRTTQGRITLSLLPWRGQRITLRLFPASARARWTLGSAVALLTAVAIAGVFVWSPWSDDGRGGGGTGGGQDKPGDLVAVLGPPRAADPCGLLDTGSFDRFGDPEMSVDYGAFDRCDVLIQKGPDDVEAADVNVDFASHPAQPDSQTSVRKAGAVKVVELPFEGDECDRGVLLADGNEVLVAAKQLDPPEMDLCALADAAVQHAVKVLNRGPVPRRPADFPADSLAHRDACDLVDAATLGVIPGIDARDADRGFGGWSCSWDGDASDGGLDIDFYRDNSLEDDDGLTPKRLGGSESYVGPEYEDDDTCSVLTVNRTYRDTAGQNTIEYVELTTYGPQPVDTLCDSAEDLATAVATKLHKP